MLVSSQKPSSRFLSNLDLSMGFCSPNDATQLLSVRTCSGLTPSPSHWAPTFFTNIPSRFDSATSLTGLKNTVSTRWEKLFKRESLPLGKIQPLFFDLCQTSWKAGERTKSVFTNGAECLCSWRQGNLLEWIGPHPWPGRTAYKKKSSKTNISSAAFLFQCIRVFWQMLFLVKQSERNLWLGKSLNTWEIHFIWHLWKRRILGCQIHFKSHQVQNSIVKGSKCYIFISISGSSIHRITES